MVFRGQKVIVTKPAEFVVGERPPHCVKCGTADIIVGLCYTGKVLDGFIDIKHEKAVLEPISLEYSIQEKKVSVPHYVKGFICDECAGEWRSITYVRGGESRTAPIIVVDPLPQMRPREERIGGMPRKSLNTRITQ